MDSYTKRLYRNAELALKNLPDLSLLYPQIKAAEASIDSFRILQKTVDSYTTRNRLKEFNAQASTIATTKENLDVLSRAFTIASDLQYTIPSLPRYNAAIEAIFQSGKDLQNIVQSAVKNFTALQSIMQTAPNLDYIKQLRSSALLKSTSVLFEAIKDIPFEEFEFADEQTVSYKGEDFDIETIKELVDQRLQDSGLIEKSDDTVKALENIIEELNRQKGSKLGDIVTVLIVTIIATIIGGIIVVFLTPKINEMSDKFFNRREIVQNVQKEIAKTEVDYDILSSYKMVIASELNVRARNSSHSRSISRLSFGTVVRVIEKRNKWTLIESQEGEGVFIQGWVYNKYLKSLIKKT